MTKYIFGYGSLINIKYIRQLVNKSRKFYPVQLANHLRHWIYAPDKRIYLGLYRQDKKLTNGVLIEVDDNEIMLLDKREGYYFREQINRNDIVQKYTSFNLGEDDIIYTYYADPKKTIKWTFDFDCEISKSYLFKCLGGCIKISSMFFEDFLLTTKGWGNLETL